MATRDGSSARKGWTHKRRSTLVVGGRRGVAGRIPCRCRAADGHETTTATTVARRTEKRRRRCRVTAQTGRSNPSRRVWSSGSAAEEGRSHNRIHDALRRFDGRRRGEAVAIGSTVRCSFAVAQAAEGDRRTGSGISARREGGAGDGTVKPSRVTEGGVSARAAHAQAAATLAGDTVTGRAIRDTGSPRDEAADRSSATSRV